MSDNKSTVSVADKLGIQHGNMDDQASRVGALTDALSATTLKSQPPAPEAAGSGSPPRVEAGSGSRARSPSAPSIKSTGPSGTAKESAKDRFNKRKTGVAQAPGGERAPAVTASASTFEGQPPVYTTSVTNVPDQGGNAYRLHGSNIGSAASEPAWNDAQLAAIQNAMSTVLKTTSMAETRRSVEDPSKHYLEIDSEGTVITKPAAMLPRIGWNEFMLGLGRPKADEKTGKGKMYSDVVMRGENWVLNQWTAIGVVIEGVQDNILEKPPRIVNGRPDRRIGHEFARVGLPKVAFAPIFETLRKSMPSVLESVTCTKGYYFMNASWGVTGSPGKFAWNGNSGPSSVQRLYEAMKMLGGKSSEGVATIAISISVESKMQNGKMVPAMDKYELSIKIHNMFHLKKVTYRSPPQSSANGFQLPSDILTGAETLDPVQNLGGFLGATTDMFSGGGINPFATASVSVSNNAAMGPGMTGREL